MERVLSKCLMFALSQSGLPSKSSALHAFVRLTESINPTTLH